MKKVNFAYCYCSKSVIYFHCAWQKDNNKKIGDACAALCPRADYVHVGKPFPAIVCTRRKNGAFQRILPHRARRFRPCRGGNSRAGQDTAWQSVYQRIRFDIQPDRRINKHSGGNTFILFAFPPRKPRRCEHFCRGRAQFGAERSLRPCNGLSRHVCFCAVSGNDCRRQRRGYRHGCTFSCKENTDKPVRQNIIIVRILTQ